MTIPDIIKKGQTVEIYAIREQELIQGLLAGSRKAFRFSEVISDWFKEARKLKKHERPCCFFCAHKFGSFRNNPPIAFVIVVPFMSDWVTGEAEIMTSAICYDCERFVTEHDVRERSNTLLGGQTLAVSSRTMN
jgi:hypothetical protein